MTKVRSLTAASLRCDDAALLMSLSDGVDEGVEDDAADATEDPVVEEVKVELPSRFGASEVVRGLDVVVEGSTSAADAAEAFPDAIVAPTGLKGRSESAETR